jgi:hypothetical protein
MLVLTHRTATAPYTAALTHCAVTAPDTAALLLGAATAPDTLLRGLTVHPQLLILLH